MAEKRKPDMVMLLRFPGKMRNWKAELFRSSKWGRDWTQKRYRIRVNGKWFCLPDEKISFFSQYEFRDLLWRSIKDIF